MIYHVIDAEGPIYEDVLVRRIERHHGFQRAGNQIEAIIVDLPEYRRGKAKEPVGIFYWPNRTAKDEFTPARYLDR